MFRPSNAPKLDDHRAERQRANFRSSLNFNAKAIISGEWAKVSKKPYKPVGDIADPDHPKWRELVELQNKILECNASRRNCKTAEATAEAEYNAIMTIRRAFPKVTRGVAEPDRPESMGSQAAPSGDDEPDETEEPEEPDDLEEPQEPVRTEDTTHPEIAMPAAVPVTEQLPAPELPTQRGQAPVLPVQMQAPALQAASTPAAVSRIQPGSLPAFSPSTTLRRGTAPLYQPQQLSHPEDDDEVIILPSPSRRTRIKRERDPSYSPEPSPGPCDTKPKTTRNRTEDFQKRLRSGDRIELNFLRKEIINKHELQLLQIERQLAKLPAEAVDARGEGPGGKAGGANE